MPIGRDCLSPARHGAFSTPLEMMGFIAELRRLSGGKPVGFKLCVGHPWEFLAICKAMLETGIRPDFIVVDGKEGGTGAAPLEFADHLGMPMRDGLVFVRNALIGAGLRGDIRIGVSGKIVNAFDMACAMALGADWCNAARGFMFALGCIQSLSCHTDRCPTGVATQDKTRSRALVVEDKTERVRNYHRSMLNALAELTAAAGLEHAHDFRPIHFSRRVGASETKTFAELYPQLQPGELIAGARESWWREQWEYGALRPFRRRRLKACALKRQWACSGIRSSRPKLTVIGAPSAGRSLAPVLNVSMMTAASASRTRTRTTAPRKATSSMTPASVLRSSPPSPRRSASGLSAIGRISPGFAPLSLRRVVARWPSMSIAPEEASTIRPSRRLSVPTNEATKRVRGAL